MRLPLALRNRTVFTLAGLLLGGIYAAFEILIGPTSPQSRLSLAIGSCLGGGLFALGVWPPHKRSGVTMVILGGVVVLLAIWMGHFSMGFFSEREISARGSALAEWVGSFFGSLFVAFLLIPITLLKTLFIPPILGLFVGSLFRDDGLS